MTQTHLRKEDTSPPAACRATTVQERLKVPTRYPSIYILPPPIDQVREDRASYVPDFLTNRNDDSEVWSEARSFAKHLIKAEGHINDALNLVNLMLASL